MSNKGENIYFFVLKFLSRDDDDAKVDFVTAWYCFLVDKGSVEWLKFLFWLPVPSNSFISAPDE